jgi:hypothetical protein
MKDNNPYYSRSALATKLGVTLKELTHTLIEAGWLEHKGENQQKDQTKVWCLTKKGEFEGGAYRESQKFGRYIVWPQSILSHDVIKNLQETAITASNISASFDISAIILNKLFSDLGWIKGKDKGWVVTDRGEKHGGIQETSEETGIPYVIWSRRIIENTLLQTHIGAYKGQKSFTSQRDIDGMSYFQLLSGLWVDNLSDLAVGNYLYICGVTFAYQRMVALCDQNKLVIDFYLPSHAVSILINHNDINPSELKQQVDRELLIEKSDLMSIQLSKAEIDEVEKILPKRLLAVGLSLY